MPTLAEYSDILRHLDNWEPYLLEHSGLPGPRANLLLAAAVADEGTAELFAALIEHTPEIAPANTPGEFLVLCGTIGLGSLLATGDGSVIPRLRLLASDPRWRVREGVATALQRLGKSDMPALLSVAREWSTGSMLEQRAAAAALCEPALLKDPAVAAEVLAVLDDITMSMHHAQCRKSDGLRVLRQGLAYCWSVAVAANPALGKPLVEKWLRAGDTQICAIMRDNLGKARLKRMDGAWVERMVAAEGAVGG